MNDLIHLCEIVAKYIVQVKIMSEKHSPSELKFLACEINNKVRFHVVFR